MLSFFQTEVDPVITGDLKMSIAKYKPTASVETKPNLPIVQPKDYKGVIVSDDKTPVLALMAFMEGAPWSIDYYSLIGSEHNDLRDIDPVAPDIYQTYQKIINFELRVSQALQNSYDSATGISTVTGSGLMVNVIVPNKGDLFTSDSGESRLGLYTVTSVERKTFNTNSVFSIEYSLIGFVDSPTVSTRVTDLEAKTARTYTFSKDRLIENLPPLVNTTDDNKVLNLKNVYQSIVTYFFKTFYNKRFHTLVLPGQEAMITDLLLTDFVLSLVNTMDAVEIQNIRRLPMENEEYLSRASIWTCLLNKDRSGLKEIWKKSGLISKHSFLSTPYGRAMGFTNIDYIVYPKDIEESLLSSKDKLPKTILVSDIVQTNNFEGTAADLLSLVYTSATGTKPLYHRITEDDYYVFSSQFYNNTINQSVIEILVKNYLDKETIDIDMLYALVNDYDRWSRLEQFYYGPVLILLIKEADRSVY